MADINNTFPQDMQGLPIPIWTGDTTMPNIVSCPISLANFPVAPLIQPWLPEQSISLANFPTAPQQPIFFGSFPQAPLIQPW